MFIAEVKFWGEDKGGRFTPPQSGFRPQIKLGDVQTSCTVTSVEDPNTSFKFDKQYSVMLELLFSDDYGDRLKMGDDVCLFEGNKQIAEGKIVNITTN